MTTPLIILGILIVPTVSAELVGRAVGRPGWFRPAGVVSLALAFFFFALGHFVKTAGMVEMLPPFVPAREALVLATGALEILLGVGLLVPRLRARAGVACLLVLVAFFPANVYAAMNGVGMGGHQSGPEYLLIRGPLQLLLLAWTYWFAVGRAPAASTRRSTLVETSA